MLKFFIPVIFSLLLCKFSAGQGHDFYNFSTDQGLPSSEVYSLLQDSKGYIWGCTDAGVFRYNGEMFTTFTKANGAPDNTVFNMVEDRHGRIWMSGFNGQVAYFQDDTFHAIGCNRELVRVLNKGGQVIYSLGIGDGDTLWLGTTYALFSIAPAQNYSVLQACDEWGDSSVTVIRQIGRNNVVVSKRPRPQSMLEVHPGHYTMQYEAKTKSGTTKFKVSKSTSVSLGPYNDALLLSDGRLLVTYHNDLYIIEKNGAVSKKEFSSVIISLTEDRNRDVWVGLVKSGVCIFRGGLFDAEPEMMLEDLSVGDVLLDHENGIWIGTLERGIFYLGNPGAKNFSDVAGLSESIIETACINDTVWVANLEHRVFIFPEHSGARQVKTFGTSFTGDKLNIYGKNGNVYLCGPEFTVLELSTGKEERPVSFYNVFISCIDMAFMGETEYLLLAPKELFEIFPGDSSEIHELPARGTSLAVGADRRVYVGTLAGLYEFRDDAFIPVFLADTFNGTRISQVKCIGNDPVIVTKGKGVFIKRRKNWQQISAQDGLASDLCNSLEIDSRGVLWIATNKGVSQVVFDKTNDTAYTIFNYDMTHGLPSNDVNTLALRGNELWAGTKKGLSAIRIDQGFYNSVPPGVRISHAVVNDSFRLTRANAVLEFNQNNITFFVDGFSFKDIGKRTIRYQLVGFDPREKEGHSRSVSYQNLPAGEYTFRVYCVNNSGVSSLVPAELKFTVLRPFWARWWFIAPVILFAAALLWLAVRWRVNLHRKKEEEKSAVIKKLADFQLTALSAQMSPHFTFNVINSIQRYVLQKQAHEAYTYLGRFSMLMRQVLNNAHDRDISLERELQTLGLYVEMEQIRFENKFDFDIHVDERIDQECTEIPAMLLQPFIENAIWHGVMPLEERRKGRIRLEIEPENENLRIRIEDNGIGREQSAKIKKSPGHTSLGLRITQQRLDLLFNRTGDQPGKIVITDLHDGEGIACGTRVELTVKYVLKSYLTEKG